MPKEFFAKLAIKEVAKSFFGLALIAASSGYLASAYIASIETSLVLTQDLSEKSLELEHARDEHRSTLDLLEAERSSAKSLEGQLGNLNSAVDVLQKYAKTDKELLAKYSKIYFLNENYLPELLTPIDSLYVLEKAKASMFLEKGYPFLKKLLEQSKSEGLDLLIASSYRSFGEQSALKSAYRTSFGTTAANKFSADQGYSEHQLGTTLDFTTSKIGGALSGFEKTKEYAWLENNAHRFGFVLSYPSGNKYYIFEPWHWRFVGVALATKLHEEDKNFYDMDQRDINEYLVRIFDKG